MTSLNIAQQLALDIGRKFELVDVEHDFELLEAAEEYLRNYKRATDAGEREHFDFLDQVSWAYTRYRDLSWGQVKGILNCMRADLLREMREQHQATVTPQVVADPAERAVRNGLYTAVIGDGSHVTLRISDCKFAEDHDQMVSYLNGPDNEYNYTGFAFLDGSGFHVWKKFQSAARLVEALEVLVNGDPEEAGKRYALESGNCYVCNRTLTDPKSIELGIGPICRGE